MTAHDFSMNAWSGVYLMVKRPNPLHAMVVAKGVIAYLPRIADLSQFSISVKLELVSTFF